MTSADDETTAQTPQDPPVSDDPFAPIGTEVRLPSDIALAADEQAMMEGLKPVRESSFIDDAINVARGFFMGAADTVPGVSGGTVALILGHYERLVNAISQIDMEAFKLIRNGEFRKAWQHIDGRFLFAVGGGVAIGVVCLAGIMHWLLDRHLAVTFAVFFGLILGSAWIVARCVDRWAGSRVLAFSCAMLVAMGISFLTPASGSSSALYLFFSASVAICAMILPGISGAFVMLLFGVYAHVTGMVKEAAKGNVSVDSLFQMGVFAAGCLFGLLAFSKVLRWLLNHHHGTTMAALVGLMVGSIGKLWPLQKPTIATAALELKEREMQYFLPADWTGTSVWILAFLVILAAVSVLGLERIASTRSAT